MKKSILLEAAFTLIIFSLLFTSCVSMKKFRESTTRVDKLQKDSANTHSQLNESNKQVNSLKEAKAALEKDKAGLEKAKASLEQDKSALEQDTTSLSKEKQLKENKPLA